MTQKLAIAALAAAALAAQAAVLRFVVAAPLASAVGELREAARPATFEETIDVVAARRPHAPRSGKRS